MLHDTIFECLIDLTFDVENSDIERFKNTMLTKGLPTEFLFETQEGVFKVNNKKKEFRILQRHSYPIGIGFPSDEQVEYTIMGMYKIALWSGYNVYLDPKYSN